MTKPTYFCPYCGSKLRVNTKHYPVQGQTKQAQCSFRGCKARGPLTTTTEMAKAIFGVEVFDA